MRIARPVRPSPAPDRPGRWLVALVLAATALAAMVVPALATAPGALLDAAASALLSASPDPSAAGSASPGSSPSGSADPSPSSSAAPSPSPSPTATPSSSPSPTASPSPTPTPTPSPAPTPTPTPWPTAVATLGSTVTFYGRGYGHGVGLSQYGARGRALAGQTSAQILGTYFRGATPATTDPARNVRVLVLAGFDATSTGPLVIYGRTGTWTVDGIARTFPANAGLRVWRTTAIVKGVTTVTWRLRVVAADGATTLHSGTASGTLVVRPAEAATRLQLWSKPSAYDTYRGLLKVFLNPASASVVNHVPLDPYLRGVVPVEMPSTWPIEALRAQAVAARSYAVRRLHPTSGNYDLYDDTRSQVYRGMKLEKATTDALIAGAPGAILVSGSSVVNAFFHSTGGGATENNEYAFVGSSGAVTSGPVGYLRGVSDRRPDGTAYDAGAPYFAWTTTTLTRAQLSAIFRTDSRTSVGDLLRLDLTRRGVSGRLYRVTLYGTTGTKTVSADVFRAVYNAARPSGSLMLRSNLFNVAPLP